MFHQKFGVLEKKNPCKYLSYRDLFCALLTKKRHCLSAMSPRWVPGRTRTVDIQNHNLTL